MTSKTQTRGNVDPYGGSTGPGSGSEASTLEGAGDHGSGSYVTSVFGNHRDGSACTVSRTWGHRAGPGTKSRIKLL